ncbi:MAG TPA: hypothetical protein VKU87_01485 [Thermomicrobiaceae bacterium]|nr:hypothetical protein [Thermomicrobiaceae bacterium]
MTNYGMDSAIDPQDLAQPYAERLAEDEDLRGSLTDAGFGPLLEWLTNLMIDAAGRAAKAPDPGVTMDRAGRLAHQLGRSIVQAAEQGDPAPVRDALAEPLLTNAQIAAAGKTLPRSLPKRISPDERARRIVAALAKAAGVGIGQGEAGEEPA